MMSLAVAIGLLVVGGMVVVTLVEQFPVWIQDAVADAIPVLFVLYWVGMVAWAVLS